MAVRLLVVLLLIVIVKVTCDGHSSAQPRGPDVDKSSGASSTASINDNHARDSNAGGGLDIGECPAKDEQVQMYSVI